MKNPRRLSCAALAAARSLTGVLTIAPQARSQIDAAPSWVPIGSSASGSSSTVWFHEPASRRTVACQTTAGADGRLADVSCVSGKLP
ncbi:MAG: hypothetical protein KBF65_16025 [Rubrivivax sp.]|jgi:hypothetical protein|nr:hypothetical protein [Betaproteobacteria bacterium]MBP6319487.1 hypothetical protein [Rubrivivax sp.]MBK7276778.1 hypothetical protein [Betaproteobacteria bacterium]MBK7458602.1 hypothetical protein [Betaproteobacteria bacterium]MBK7515543.1 hypothetical protein [Betaproteobacteria bacterium]